MTTRPEVLSPAGSWESLKAAAAAGADAVYFGAADFNARRGAVNFGNDEIIEVVRYCHGRGIKAYFTLNTVIFEREINKALKLVSIVCESGADAIILQDVGLSRLISKAAPGIKLHASTQMSVHNLSGVNELARMGFSRVVLARELSSEEIAQIAANSPIELEIFVHGALCMSVSGQCYMSAFFGGCRSGNRGLCAQPCRLPFSVNNQSNVLSLKDLSLINQVRELSKNGVFSLKIEGRRKRPEYVSAATLLCSKAARGEKITVEEIDELSAVFSREGFTQGYYEGRLGRSMFGTRTPEDMAASASIAATKKSQGHSERSEPARVKVDFRFLLSADTTELIACDEDGNEVIVQGANPERARTRAVDSVIVGEKLARTGGTPFFAGNISSSINPEFTVAVSEINSLRRKALSALLEKRSQSKAIPFEMPKREGCDALPNRTQKLRLRFRTASQIPSGLEFDDVDIVYLPLSELCHGIPQVIPKGLAVGVELPRSLFGDESGIMTQLAKVAEFGVKYALCGNLGSINCARRAGFAIHGDFGLNITNSEAVRAFSDSNFGDSDADAHSTKSFVISIEAPYSSIRDIASLCTSPCGVVVYGRLPLMLVRNCPVRSFSKCAPESDQCRCEIKDRTGCLFPVVCQKSKNNAAATQCVEILNSRPLWLSDLKQEIIKTGIEFAQLYFSTESSLEARRVIDAWKSGETCSGEFTRGLYFSTIS